MGFMQSANGDGNFKVFVKYNAKAGRFYTKKDEKDAPEFEVTNLTAVFDMDNLKTGWFLFAPSVAPVKSFNPDMETWIPSPGEGFKRGFELDLFSEKNLLGVREFSSTASVVIDAMNELYDNWMAAPESSANKLPVVKCAGVLPVVNKHGTNYQPQFAIVGWVDRPAELGGGVPKQEEKPAPAPAPAMAGGHDDDDVEF